MAATKTAEKSQKQTAKTAAAPKVFDIARPGKSTPSASARPVIVTNRPILQDPMVATATDQAEPMLASKPSGKITIKPIDEITDKDNSKDTGSKEPKEKLASAPEISLDLDTLDNLAADKPAEESKKESAAKPEKDTPADKNSEKSEPEDSKDTDDSPAKAKGSDAAEAATKTADATEVAEVAVHADKVGSGADTGSQGTKDAGDAPEGTPPEDGTNAESKDQKELAALEAKAKQEEEINKLVESKEYFLPINAVERHRSKVIALLGLLLIIVLALVLLDVMMDSGMLHIPGVSPVTHFFSALSN